MTVRGWWRVAAAAIIVAVTAGACSSDPSPTEEAAERRDLLSQRFPEIVRASFDPIGETTWSVRVTMSSPYDTPERYADAWRVLTVDGEVLGVRELTHDHATEQPFTRALNNVEIPADATSVLVEGRDLVNGWSGDPVEFELPERDS